jgi:hypothetical protein
VCVCVCMCVCVCVCVVEGGGEAQHAVVLVHHLRTFLVCVVVRGLVV